MYFRSQDRLFLGKVEQVSLIDSKGKYTVGGFTSIQDESYVILGTYKSEERFIEVLDEIQKNIIYESAMSKFCTNIKGLPRDGALLEGIIENLLGTAAVYTMPQE